MPKIKFIIVSLAILCPLVVCHTQETARPAEVLKSGSNNTVETEVETRSLSTSSEIIKTSKTLFQYGLGVENTNIHYVECDPPNQTFSECRLLMGSSTFENKTEWASCGFRMKINTLSPRKATYMRIYRFGKSKMLILWIEYGGPPVLVTHVDSKTVNVNAYVRFAVVDRPTCRTEQFSTRGSSRTLNRFIMQNTIKVHLSDHLFDIIYAYDNGLLARERFNSMGERLTGPVSVTDPKIGPNLIRPITISDPPNFDRISRCFQVWPQERLKIGPGWDLSDHVPEMNITALVGWSTANGYVGYCERAELGRHKKPKHEADWACEQLRPNSNSMVKSIWLWFDYKPRTAMIYNMPEGGFLTITSKELPRDDYESNQTFWLIKFSSDGKAYKPIEFLNLDCKYSSMLLGHFFRDEKTGDFCFALLPDKKMSDFVVKCYPEEILSQDRA
ncbi:hypothetical protein QAD02_005938 [Eretmocerus hayati]|uniref:Uncharacterized protein n=1 Tax=Eretmocerus hayati TaxID=131215 RepID=A0ACC2N0A9_9HYME|nr:hypothetical protein QAD02_005938 [Eretmocerus hayati]